MGVYLEGVTKSYTSGDTSIKVLNNVGVEVETGMTCVVMGPSGSGKSTLLNVIGGLDTIDRGSIVVEGTDVSTLTAKQLAQYRRAHLGFVFQFYNLVPNLTVKENIQVCEYLTDTPLPLEELLDQLGLTDHVDKFPHQVSGGQQQRCAIARALIKNPSLLLCDEPTGALDYKASKEILALLEQINQTYKTTMIIVTHNAAIERMVDQVVHLKDGSIRESYLNADPVAATDLEW